MPEFVLILIRSIIAFFVLMIMTRLMGKKQLSQLTFFDYVVGITIGSIAATLSVDQNTTALNGLVGIMVWGLFPIVLGYLDMKSFPIRKLTDGKPTLLVSKGKILEDNLKKERLTVNELLLLLREKNAFRLQDVEFAVLETNGQLSVMKKSEAEPITPKMIGMMVENNEMFKTVIMDGKLMERTLHSLGFSNEWLLEEIRKYGAEDIEDVFYAQLDQNGNLYLDLYQDKEHQFTIRSKEKLAATLKKAHADFKALAQQTQHDEAKRLYQEQIAKLEKMIADVEPYLHE